MQNQINKNLLILIFLLLCGLSSNINAQIKVNLPDNPQITSIQPAIRGFNHGDFQWVPWDQIDSPEFRKEFDELLPGIIRWPGGTNANNYIWQNYLHDESRFHLINAIEFIRDMNIDFQYVVNFGNGSAGETADFVRLCNSKNPYWQNERVSLFGKPDPVNLKIVEIGNENYGTWTWVASWFAKAIDEKIYFRNGTYFDFPAYISDSLYFYGGDIWRGGWVDPKTIEVHHHKTYGILGEKYLIQPDDGDTIIVSVSYPKIGTDSIYVWVVDTLLTETEIDQLPLSEMYDLVTEPKYLLDNQYFSILDDSAIMVYPPIPPKSGELIYIEYQSVGHDGAFAFRDSIKAADPTVQVGYNVWPNDDLLTRSFFQNDFSQSPPDFIIRHTYPNTADMQWLADNNYFSEIVYLPQQIVEQYIAVGQAIMDSVTADLGMTKRLAIALTEWSFANAACKECNMDMFDGILGAMNTAMFTASYQEALHNSTVNLLVLNFFTLIGSDISIYGIDKNMNNPVTTSRAHAMRMLNNTIGTKFFTIDSINITGNPMLKILSKNLEGAIETIEIPAVKIWGGIDSLHNDYSLFLINQDDSVEHGITFHVPTAWAADSVFVEIMTGIPDSSVYHLENETLVIIDDSMQITLPAFSLTAIRFGSTSTGVPANTSPVKTFSLDNAYPNPFNSSTLISYQLAAKAIVKLTIYNVLGQKVRTLVDQNQTAGSYWIHWDGKNDLGNQLSSGIYLYQIKISDNFLQTKKVLLLR